MTGKLKILFHMPEAVGPQNACVGLGQELQERGHEVYMITKTNHRLNGRFTDYGFKVCPMLATEDGHEITDEEAIEEQKKETEYFAMMGVFDETDLKVKMKKVMEHFITDEFVAPYKEYEVQCRKWIDQVKPDLIVADTIGLTPPSLMHSGIPWVLLYCSNPLALFKSEKLPPAFYGLPVDSPRESWLEYRQVTEKHHDAHIAKYQHKLMRKCNYPVPETPEFSLLSPYLNIFQFPLELDYSDVATLPETFCRVDAFCRTELGPFEIPHKLKCQMKPGDKLIYFSLGSIGTSNVKLMNRILGVLAKTPYFFIVSMGIFQEEIILGENMWGDRYVPQTKILPIVDSAIIHGGNNSLTEAIHFGVPIIVMPLFYDQLDNGQRIQEKGYGLRVDPYRFTDEQLFQALETVLNDRQMKEKFTKASQRIQASQSKVKACIAMEKVVENFNKK